MLNETGVPEIQETVMIFHEMTMEEQAEEIERMREKKIRDDESLYRMGRKEGREEVLAKMRKFGLSEEEIQKVKEMSENE